MCLAGCLCEGLRQGEKRNGQEVSRSRGKGFGVFKQTTSRTATPKHTAGTELALQQTKEVHDLGVKNLGTLSLYSHENVPGPFHKLGIPPLSLYMPILYLAKFWLKHSANIHV